VVTGSVTVTRWSSILDPYTLAYLAGHSDFGTTKRYVHPNLNTAREAIEKARNAQDTRQTDSLNNRRLLSDSNRTHGSVAILTAHLGAVAVSAPTAICK